MYNPFLPDKAAAAPTGPLTLATVGTVSADGVTLILPGSTEPTQAHYPNFSSSSLASGDSVIISRVSGTWVVMGKAGGGGGGGGTSDYNDLSNKPSINGNTLSGNKTAAQLGLGTYSKPSGGIPASDLASAVQTSLGKADSALQSVPSTYRTAAEQDAIDAGFCPYNQISVTGYSTYKMTLPSLSGHFVFIVGSSLSRSAILYIVVQSSGVVAVEEIQKGANFTYTVGTNELTFGNGATYAIYIKEIPIRGNPITVEPVS